MTSSTVSLKLSVHNNALIKKPTLQSNSEIDDNIFSMSKAMISLANVSLAHAELKPVTV
jgi:hypothetical protein